MFDRLNLIKFAYEQRNNIYRHQVLKTYRKMQGPTLIYLNIDILDKKNNIHNSYVNNSGIIFLNNVKAI